jgi:AraC family transcriptional regulator of adaptative response/methylated-DNA-[protein]-cysteine methyltransferase
MTSVLLSDQCDTGDAAAACRYASDASRWHAVMTRDRAADAFFVVAVRTTGIYGRPSSSARIPRRDNVEFFDTPDAAEAAGYRPSRRAVADGTQAAERRSQLVAQTCRAIEQSDTSPALADLAAQAGISSFHLHRLFKQETGLTPKAYATAFRAQRLRGQLADAPTVTQAIYDAGFNSHSRFYQESDGRLGMRPQAFRAGGVDTDIHFAIGQTTLGAVLVAGSPRGICAILLGDDPDALLRDLQDQFPKARLIGADPSFEEWVAQVVGLVDAPGLGLHLPLDVQGTAFQERVWRALRNIPAGTTISYTELAARIGSPSSARAVAQACGANRLAVAIPCHRVVRIGGDLAGYRWGVERKRELLRKELLEKDVLPDASVRPEGKE